MNRAELERTAEMLLGFATAAGADAAEVMATSGRSLSAKFEKGDLGQVQADEGTSLGLRVVVGGRLGFTSTNQTAERSLRAAAEDAVAIARTSPPDEANVLPGPGSIAAERLIGPRRDERLAGLGIAEAVERAAALHAAVVRHDARLSVDQATFSSVAGATFVLSTTGVRAFDEDAAVTLGLMALAVDGDETGGFDYRGTVARDLDRLDGEATRMAAEVARACIGNLGGRPGRSYVGPVLFAPAAFSTAFVGPLLGALSALAVQRGRSALADRLGERIAPGLDLVDDPTDLGSAGARAFDREGQPTSRLAILEDGVLRTYLHNTYTSRIANTATTAHAQGGPRSVPGLGAHAIYLAGTRPNAPTDEEAMLRALGTGLYVQRISGSVDPASGDFSGAAKSARWVENGEIVHSVQEIMLSGNAFKLLQDPPTLSTQTTRLSGNSQLPHALIDQVTVTTQ